MNILMIAPMPTHPATQGSRQRAFDMARAFQKMGDTVTFLYWAAEGLDHGGRESMNEAWDDVQIVSCDGHVPRRSYPAHYGIDDWYHEAIGERIRALNSERTFDVCVVNYVWLSRALIALPDSCVRIIDTHDLFGDRADKFIAIGRRPEWYYTSISEERRGLDRADLVIAIQSEEAIEAQKRTRSEVLEVGFLTRPYPVQRLRADADQGTVVGYIGSSNPFNIVSVAGFCEALRGVDVPAGVSFVAAGPICDMLQTIPLQPFRLLGRVPDLAGFYASIDVAINPMMGGTGLKIKTIEALAHGVGLIGTVSAFAGIPTNLPEQNGRSIEEVVQAVLDVCAQPEAVEALRLNSMAVFDRYISTQERHFAAMYARVQDFQQARLTGKPVSEIPAIVPNDNIAVPLPFDVAGHNDVTNGSPKRSANGARRSNAKRARQKSAVGPE